MSVLSLYFQLIMPVGIVRVRTKATEFSLVSRAWNNVKWQLDATR